MNKRNKLLTLLSASIAMCGFMVSVPQSNNVQAATIKLPQGYTKSAIIKWNQTGRYNQKLVNASIKGMVQNTDAQAGNNTREVNVTHLTKRERTELAKYALSTINSARKQMGKKKWTYKPAAQHFAEKVAKEYYLHGKSNWDQKHYLAGIKRAAKRSGLNNKLGQVYEDEAGLPISSDYHDQYRPMNVLKKQIYFNIKQMLFGGFYGNDNQMNNPYYYNEWEHAGDLLGLRTKHYDAKTKYFGMAFSGLKDDPSKLSVHMLSVDKRYIQNYKKFK